MEQSRLDILQNAAIPTEVRAALASGFAGLEERGPLAEIETRRLRLEERRIFWNTPVALALGGLITLGAQYVFGSMTADSAARTEASAREMSFQYDILKSALIDDDRTNDEVATMLLFLTEIGALSALNEEKLIQRATAQKANPNTNILPRFRPGLATFADLGLSPETINDGLQVATQAFMLEALGRPRATLTDMCEPPDTFLADQMRSGTVGPFNATLLAPAHESLQSVFENVEKNDPGLLSVFGSAGGLCVRRVRGSSTSFSNHSWGTAIDLTVDNKLDAIDDGLIQTSLAELAVYMKEAGWVWGAGFPREDSMHFEASQGLVQSWIDAGLVIPQKK